MKPKHPAKFSQPIIEEMAKWISPGSVVLDPFAGVGGICKLHDLVPNLFIIANELEEEWANQIQAVPYKTTVTVGRAQDFYYWKCNADSIDVVATSPCYGNRMADHHEAKDKSVRNTYRHKLGRMPSEGSGAVLQWGKEYRDLHREIWTRMKALLRPGGRFLLNISDHIRSKRRRYVSSWHVETLLGLGLVLEAGVPIKTKRNRFGTNSEARVEHENLFVFRKVEK